MSGRNAVDEILRDERPLTARSVVASTLLGIEPPELPARLLVRSGGLFGIAEGTTRVALSRMVATGELEAVDGRYRLAGPLVSRQARQIASRAGLTRTWRGGWLMSVVVADQRSAVDRAAMRSAARSLRLAERREGVWLRPDNLTAAHGHAVEAAAGVLREQCETYAVRPAGDPAELAGLLWDLDGWARRALTLGRALEQLAPALEVRRPAEPRARAAEGTPLGHSFVVSAAVLRHFQADPLLPTELLPDNWPGESLRDAHRSFDAMFKAAWAAWFRNHS